MVFNNTFHKKGKFSCFTRQLKQIKTAGNTNNVNTLLADTCAASIVGKTIIL